MSNTTTRTLLGVATACIALCTAALSGLAQAPPHGPGGPADPLGPDLYFAISAGRVDQINDLLAKGAKTEARNWLGITPLLWAASRGSDRACAALIEHNADVNGDSIYGGALEFGVLSGSPKVVRLLLDHGARLSSKRTDRITALMSAADGGSPEIVKMLLPLKPDVNAADASGATALIQASRRGRLEVARLLLDAGADVNTADGFGRTPLMYASLNGYPSVVQLLLDRGARVNETDKSGRSALALTAAYSGDASLTALLLKAGADRKARDAQGRTSAEVAMRRGYRACATAIDPSVHPAAPAAAVPLAERASRAAMVSLPLIERTTRAFTEHSGCSSCHHQGLGLMATGNAQSLGFSVDRQLAASEQKVVLADVEGGIEDIRKLIPHPEMYKHFVAVDMNELTPGFSFTLCGLAAQGAPRTEAAEACATILARQQLPDGSWGFGFVRAPIQSSPFATTAFTIQAINTYIPAALESERKDRIRKALVWLQATPARDAEDRAFRLLALKWAGALQPEIDRAAADVRRNQRKDGGWAQFTAATPAGEGFTRSDAYATGESLYALHVGADVKPTDAAYQRGVTYLLNTQDDDGSWFVNKRAVPANNYFDTGFPHGESQFISYGATCWSTMALMFAAHPATPALRASR